MNLKGYIPKTKPALWRSTPSGKRQERIQAKRLDERKRTVLAARQRPRKAIRRRSKKMTKLMAQYRKQRAAYLRLAPWCGVCHTAKATDVHHKRGRGPYLLMSLTWIGVCRICHNYIHAHPSWAYAEGLLLHR